MAFHRRAGVVLAAAASAVLCACSGDSVSPPDVNTKPGFVGTITKSSYDGNLDDLLTAGLGKSGLAGAAPTFADPLNPTAAELRRLVIYVNYRAIVDTAASGGYGTLYGPNLDVNGNPVLGEGKVAGTEYLAYADDGSGRQNVTMMVQVPASFSKASACIVTATSSGSRGVYGAIGSAGEWGLKRGCAVAYTDKGTGTGFHDLSANTVTQQNGVRAGAAAAGRNSNFTADLSAAELASFNAATPNRFAVKHAHSQQNPEKDWGRDTLNAIRFAFYVLNEERGDRNTDGTAKNTFRPDNTIVIASSVSNGAGAAIAALEQDTEGLIDGLAVSEPNVAPTPGGNLVVRRGSVTTEGSGRPLYDYYTFTNLLQPCAALSAAAQGSPGAAFLNTAIATNRCASLKAKGLVAGSSTAEFAADAMNQLIAFGWQPEANLLHATHYALNVTPSIATTYSNSYGRFSVRDNLCGLSFAATDAAGKPIALAANTLAQSFSNSSGVPPTASINIVNNDAPGGPVNSPASVSASTGLADYNIDAATCQRDLWTGSGALATRVQNGVKETYRTANLRGRPAIIVHGRADAVVPVAFSSRPYYGMNRIVEGSASKLTYIEVTNAQHLDALNSTVAGYDTLFVPLHYYFVKAMDAMWAHLTINVPLPPAQLVRAVPRGGTAGSAPPITTANVPPILAAPPAANQITFAGNTLTIPD
ncbi:MAG: D-(-)-3-hydroxybutyrate oligomer hydrolase [Burkholderiales bacterium]